LEKAFALYCRGYAVHDVDREAAKRLCEASATLYEALGDRHGLCRVSKILGEVISQLGDYGQGRRLIETSLGHARTVGDQRMVAECLQWLSFMAVYLGQVEETARFARESADIYRAIGAQAELGYSLTMLAGSFMLRGQFAEARPRVLEAVQTFDEIGLRHAYSAMPRSWLAMIAWLAGDYEQARQRAGPALAMARDTDWKRGVALCNLILGCINLVEGASEQALKLLEESAATCQAIKEIDDYVLVLACMGYAQFALGRPAQARGRLLEALRLGAELGVMLPVAAALPGIALLWASSGHAERAVDLYALASSIPTIGNSPWFEDVAGRHIAAAAAALPPDTVAAARARGQARDLQSTIAELLAEFEVGDHE
jgi:tetratricopeptide (TPR) repeat protein